MWVYLPAALCSVCRVSAAHWLGEDGRAAQRLGAPPCEFVKTFQQSHGTPVTGNCCSGPVRSRRPPHFPSACGHSERLARLGSARLGGTGSEGKVKRSERKRRSDKESRPLTMKPVFMLIVSTAWTLTGAQYYYQGLMDYLENRLLAIEVRKNDLHQYNLIISPFLSAPWMCLRTLEKIGEIIKNVSSCLDCFQTEAMQLMQSVLSSSASRGASGGKSVDACKAHCLCWSFAISMAIWGSGKSRGTESFAAIWRQRSQQQIRMFKQNDQRQE